mgnify:CR=1 FL=1
MKTVKSEVEFWSKTLTEISSKTVLFRKDSKTDEFLQTDGILDLGFIEIKIYQNLDFLEI